jgi:hypothetical protein
MTYRGKHYIVVQGIEPNSWKWSVDLDPGTVKSGSAKSRLAAVQAVQRVVDQAQAPKKRRVTEPDR